MLRNAPAAPAVRPELARLMVAEGVDAATAASRPASATCAPRLPGCNRRPAPRCAGRVLGREWTSP